MAVINDVVTKDEQQIYKKQCDTTKIKTNINVLKKIYNNYDTLELLVADTKLMNKIVKNGYYKAAVCERFNIQVMNITLDDGTEHAFIALGDVDICKLVKNELDIIPIDIELVDEPI